ncbi:MAG: DUF3943 domain-containing protein [Saprospiraceae bacterium]|nr:DUF3943 domain-containing protein [Bacteroidia bacterium]NNE14682.1 DUF3943 domain-containing protein [Saprospiraceae bacterium]NNL93915.1 DUF3943 domain-containing protein [Saprospiraceae bacterium]
MAKIYIIIFITSIHNIEAQHDSLLLKNINDYNPAKPALISSQVLSSNILINRFDAWVLNKDWAKVGLDDWGNNITSGFSSDGDAFGTNFFGHPFHGSLFYNAARHNGYSFLESIPYVMAGSLSWEYLGETFPPSIIDWYTTVLGGAYLGEVTHRLSLSLLRNDQKRKHKFFRNAAVTIINPTLQFNSLINDYTSNFARKNDDDLPKVITNLSIGTNHVLQSNLDANFQPWGHLKFNLIYGTLFDRKVNYKPFDFFILKSWLDFSHINDKKKFYFNLISHAPLFNNVLSSHSTITISQHFDYIHNPLFKIGSLAISGDYNFKYFEGITAFSGSLKSGFILFGSSNSEVVEVIDIFTEDGGEFLRDYIYGQGIYFEAEAFLAIQKWGRIFGSFNNWIIYSEEHLDGIENSTIIKLEYQYPIFKDLLIGIEYYVYRRHAEYKYIPGFENILNKYKELRISLSHDF